MLPTDLFEQIHFAFPVYAKSPAIAGRPQVEAPGDGPIRQDCCDSRQTRGYSLDHQRMEGERKGSAEIDRLEANRGMTLEEILASPRYVDMAKIDATTEEDIRRHMIEEGDDPDEDFRIDRVCPPLIVRKRLGTWPSLLFSPR